MNDSNPTAAQVIHLKGDHYRMGYQHGQQTKWLRRYIIEAINARFERLARDNPDEAFEALVQETRRVVQTADPATIDFIRGQADSLEFDFDWLMRYNLVNFLRDALTTRPDAATTQSGECTTWAATGSATTDGRPILAKNRDYQLEHLPLQVVARAEPAAGYGHIYVTSAGNPGVFVAGLNEAGLAVADTHVPCPDVGPGLPTFALSMHLLEEHRTVASALAYLQRMPRLGRNNLLLADAGGELAVFENGHSRGAVVRPDADILVATNHFNSPFMRDCFVDTEPLPLQGNTFHRYQKVKQSLTAAHGQIDVAEAKQLMVSHDGPLASLCRHPLPESMSSTISSTILLPVQRRIHFCHGQPCQATYAILECPLPTG
jgi:isopenicillin-N N-acyltransferase-like protein